MRYFILLAIAVGLFILLPQFTTLTSTAQSLLVLGAAGMFAYYLWDGFRSGLMEAPGVGYLAGDRIEQPLLFWFCTVFNAAMMICAIWAAIGIGGYLG